MNNCIKNGLKREGASCSLNNNCIYPECINKIEALHYPHSKTWDCYNDEPLKENHALKSAQITEDIAIEFADFIEKNKQYLHYWKSKYTTKELFDLYIKTKQ